jgi:hypothetical protein
MINTWRTWSRRRWRGEKATPEVEPGAVVYDDVASEVATRMYLRDLLATLSGRQRAVLVLRLYDDLPEAQVAEMLSCSTGTVKKSLLPGVSDQRKRWPAGSCAAARLREERQIMSESALLPRLPKPLAAGAFQPEISSFRLGLAAGGKAAKTVQMYTEAVQRFAAAHLIPQTSWTR